MDSENRVSRRDNLKKHFVEILSDIDAADSLSDLETIIKGLRCDYIVGSLALSVAIYVIDKKKLYREDDCTSITAFVEKNAERLGESKSMLGLRRRIGAGFYQNFLWLKQNGITVADFDGKLSSLLYLTDARKHHPDKDIVEALRNLSVTRFKAFARPPTRSISGSAAVPHSLGIESFETTLMSLVEINGTAEQRELIQNAYTKDLETGNYTLDKDLGTEARDKIIDIMYYVGYKNSQSWNLENWMENNIPTLVTSHPLRERSPRLLFPDDNDVPREPIRSRLLKEVRKQILKAGAEHE